MSTDPAKKSRRRVLLGLAHKGAVQLGWDDAFRREQQARLTGKASCRDMSDGQLLAWCWHLKSLGADIGIPGQMPRGGIRLDRPTPSQLAALERLALAMGWDGLDDARVAGFVRRTATVDNIRFLSRANATACIAGLTRWARQRGINTGDPRRPHREWFATNDHFPDANHEDTTNGH